jgi:hypothetical protein
MKTIRISIACLCSILFVSLLSSCAQSGRKPLDPTPFSKTLPGAPHPDILIGFEESIPGKPLNQTVWDNVSGPFWDVDECKQIGLTVHYKPQFFFIPPEDVPVFAKAGINLNDTQLIIPFGNIFSSTMESAARNNFSHATLCYDEGCISSKSAPTMLRIKIEQFYVWETPLNHLNLYVKGRSLCSRGGAPVKEHKFERHMMYEKIGGLVSPYSRTIDEKVGALLTTPGKFMEEMNRISNIFAEALTAEILHNGL